MTTCDDHTRPGQAGQVPSFVQIPTALLYSGLSGDAVKLHAILLDQSWRGGVCWPSDRSLGAWLGGQGPPKSPDTVNRLLKKLEGAGLVARSRVPASPENPTGRLITVYGQVPPRRKPTGGGAAKPPGKGAAAVRRNLIQEKKSYGPPTPTSGAARDETKTIEERLLEARRDLERAAGPSLSRWPRMLDAAREAMAELERELEASRALEASGADRPPLAPAAAEGPVLTPSAVPRPPQATQTPAPPAAPAAAKPEGGGARERPAPSASRPEPVRPRPPAAAPRPAPVVSRTPTVRPRPAPAARRPGGAGGPPPLGLVSGILGGVFGGRWASFLSAGGGREPGADAEGGPRGDPRGPLGGAGP